MLDVPLKNVRHATMRAERLMGAKWFKQAKPGTNHETFNNDKRLNLDWF